MWGNGTLVLLPWFVLCYQLPSSHTCVFSSTWGQITPVLISNVIDKFCLFSLHISGIIEYVLFVLSFFHSTLCLWDAYIGVLWAVGSFSLLFMFSCINIYPFCYTGVCSVRITLEDAHFLFLSHVSSAAMRIVPVFSWTCCCWHLPKSTIARCEVCVYSALATTASWLSTMLFFEIMKLDWRNNFDLYSKIKYVKMCTRLERQFRTTLFGAWMPCQGKVGWSSPWRWRWIESGSTSYILCYLGHVI